MNKCYIGVDIGGTFMKLGVITYTGKVFYKEKVASSNTLDIILKDIFKFLHKQLETYEILGVGISLPGVIRQDGIMQTGGALKCMIGQNVKEIAQDYLKYPVEIITDSKAAALAEGWIGSGIQFQDYVCVTMGSAIGGAIVLNKEIYWGLGGLAGEFGVSLLGRDHDTYKLDSASLHAGVVGGLCRKYSIAVGMEVKDAAYIFSLADKKDELAQKIVKEYLDDIARLLVNISVYIAPQAILLGGGISENTSIMAQIQTAYQHVQTQYSVLSMVTMPHVLPCKLKNEAGMIGAVKYFMDMQERGKCECR